MDWGGKSTRLGRVLEFLVTQGAFPLDVPR